MANRSIPEDAIDAVRSAVDIAEVIGRFVVLKKAGRNLKGLCPFHSEKTPSFNVSPERQMYYCFGCSEGGNVFTFLMKMEGMDFPETVRKLAAERGVPLPESSDTRPEDEAPRERLFRANEVAAAWFELLLHRGPDAEVAREYLRERGVRSASAKTFRLGFGGVRWDALVQALEREGVDLADAETLGLIVRGRQGRFYDRFRGRIVFPIADTTGRIRGFGGRVVPAVWADSENGAPAAKYVNSPESPIYRKSALLYGLAVNRDAIRRARQAVVVEGYLDVVMLQQEGVPFAVAPCGTALTDEQLGLVRRYAQTLHVTFDGDEAGQRAADRAAELVLGTGLLGRVGLSDERSALDVRVIELPDRLDPDDFVRRHGGEAFAQLLTHARPVVDHVIERVVATAAAAGSGVEARVAAARRLQPVFGALPAGMARDEWLRRASQALELPEEQFRPEVARAATMPTAAGGRRPHVALPEHEEKALAVLCAHPELIPAAYNEGMHDLILNDALRALVVQLFEAAADTAGAVERVLESFPDTDVCARVRALVMGGAGDAPLEDVVRVLREKASAERGAGELQAAIRRAEQAGDVELARELTRRKLAAAEPRRARGGLKIRLS